MDAVSDDVVALEDVTPAMLVAWEVDAPDVETPPREEDVVTDELLSDANEEDAGDRLVDG